MSKMKTQQHLAFAGTMSQLFRKENMNILNGKVIPFKMYFITIICQYKLINNGKTG